MPSHFGTFLATIEAELRGKTDNTPIIAIFRSILADTSSEGKSLKQKAALLAVKQSDTAVTIALHEGLNNILNILADYKILLLTPLFITSTEIKLLAALTHMLNIYIDLYKEKYQAETQQIKPLENFLRQLNAKGNINALETLKTQSPEEINALLLNYQLAIQAFINVGIDEESFKIFKMQMQMVGITCKTIFALYGKEKASTATTNHPLLLEVNVLAGTIGNSSRSSHNTRGDARDISADFQSRESETNEHARGAEPDPVSTSAASSSASSSFRGQSAALFSGSTDAGASSSSEYSPEPSSGPGLSPRSE